MYHNRLRLLAASALLFLGASFPAGAASPYEEGLAAYKKGEWETAYKLLKPIAETDTSQSAVAQQRLGLLTENGRGTAKDPAQAAKFAWYVAVPAALTLVVASNPDVLNSIIKNVRRERPGGKMTASRAAGGQRVGARGARRRSQPLARPPSTPPPLPPHRPATPLFSALVRRLPARRPPSPHPG